MRAASHAANRLASRCQAALVGYGLFLRISRFRLGSVTAQRQSYQRGSSVRPIVSAQPVCDLENYVVGVCLDRSSLSSTSAVRALAMLIAASPP